jgi:hypothetical protein
MIPQRLLNKLARWVEVQQELITEAEDARDFALLVDREQKLAYLQELHVRMSPAQPARQPDAEAA